METRTRNILIGAGVVVTVVGGILIFKKTAQAQTTPDTATKPTTGTDLTTPTPPTTGDVPVEVYIPPDTVEPTTVVPVIPKITLDPVTVAALAKAAGRPVVMTAAQMDALTINSVNRANPPAVKYPQATTFFDKTGTALLQYKLTSEQAKATILGYKSASNFQTVRANMLDLALKQFLPTPKMQTVKTGAGASSTSVPQAVPPSATELAAAKAKLQAYIYSMYQDPNLFTSAKTDSQWAFLFNVECPDTLYAEYSAKKVCPPPVLIGYILANLEQEAQWANSQKQYAGSYIVPLEFGDKDWWNWPEDKRIRYVINTCRKG